MEKEKKSILRTITDVIGALIVLAIICVLVWYFLIRDPFPTTLTEEMMTSRCADRGGGGSGCR